ncbi:MAG: glycosyltransferase [Nitrospirae bacterium]|nr:glycosyltransferase [Nitrospirota bacterium]
MIPLLIVWSYFAILLALSLYGLHRVAMLYWYFRYSRCSTPHPLRPTAPEDYPPVTVQLPLYNEMYVTDRLIKAVSRLRYPRQRLRIQILDDSTDHTQDLARAVAADLSARGFLVTYHHRMDRQDYKAGALRAGMALSRDDFFAIFDADFLPPPDFLERTIPYFTDQRVGMVQARWGYVNEGYSLLTRLQAMLLDGHFVIEHSARYFSGRFFNFNGTAGIWRRQAIEEAGGWQGDTLTEDLDLSYRAQMKGWRFVFVPNLVCPSELPVDLHALRHQQYRWTKGSLQVCRKLLPAIWMAALPLRVKIEATCHLTANVNYLLMAALTVLTPASLVLRYRIGREGLLFWETSLVLFSVVSIGVFYLVTQVEQGRRWTARIGHIPLIVAFGIGMSINNARAVIDALRSRESPFVRTAKYGIESTGDAWTDKTYRSLGHGIPIAESCLALYLAASLGALVALKNWGALPLMLLLMAGFSYVSFLAVLHAKS